MHLKKSSLLPFWQFVNVTQAMLNVAKVGVSTLSWYRVQTHIGTASKILSSRKNTVTQWKLYSWWYHKNVANVWYKIEKYT